MSLLRNKGSQPAPSQPAPAPAGGLQMRKVTKGDQVLLTKKSAAGDDFTLITTWGDKDYDLYALVEYMDGHVETVSCFGTDAAPKSFTTRTNDGSVVHVSGDETAYSVDAPQEVISVHLNPQIRCVVPVVYSAQNSGQGSFYRYRVSTFVVRGKHQTVPHDGSAEMVSIEAVEANRDDQVYTFVPAVIHNGPNGATIEAVELYSRRNSENRPQVRDGVVTMDAGPRNAYK